MLALSHPEGGTQRLPEAPRRLSDFNMVSGGGGGGVGGGTKRSCRSAFTLASGVLSGTNQMLTARHKSIWSHQYQVTLL